MEIRPTARKHGVADADMVHALRFYRVRVPPIDGVGIYLGFDRAGNTFLEIGVVEDDLGLRIIHAMPARPKFLR